MKTKAGSRRILSAIIAFRRVFPVTFLVLMSSHAWSQLGKAYRGTSAIIPGPNAKENEMALRYMDVSAGLGRQVGPGGVPQCSMALSHSETGRSEVCSQSTLLRCSELCSTAHASGLHWLAIVSILIRIRPRMASTSALSISTCDAIHIEHSTCTATASQSPAPVS